MTLEDLIAAVQEIVQDSFWTDDKITTILNRGLSAVATGVLLPDRYQLTPPLPFLYSVDTIDTSAGSGICDLPNDFGRSLVQVINSDSAEIRIEPSFVKFLKDHPEQDAGAVWTCAQQGKRLLYRDIPSAAETLTVHYYAAPSELSSDSDEPECIPEHLQHQILTGYACMQIFNLIEDGIEGQKINTAAWRAEYFQGLAGLEIAVGFDALPDEYQDLTERIA